MKKKMMAIVMSLLCIGLTACDTDINRSTQLDNNSSTSKQTDSTIVLNYTNIKPDQAKKRLDSETGIVLLDVRTEGEYAASHIPNSVLIPLDVIEKEAPSKLTDKNAAIFVYCRSGNRSVTASKALVKMGYSNVYNLGGIIDWPYETESGE